MLGQAAGVERCELGTYYKRCNDSRNGAKMARFEKQRSGHMNPIFHQEEIGLLAALDKAQKSTTNSQILGKHGEKGLVGFLNRYLPNCFRVVSGHFVTPSGLLSPEIDAILMDARYPLLSQDENGLAVAMLHSVIMTIEVKLSLVKKEIVKIRQNDEAIAKLAEEVFPLKNVTSVRQCAFAYRADIRVRTVTRHYFAQWRDHEPPGSIDILRVHDADQGGAEGPLGSFIWLEAGEYPAIVATIAPLSDFYYRLVQDSSH
jgi:uncharacterized protein DUF6602